MGTDNADPIGIRSPDRPAHSESQYRLRYPGTHLIPVLDDLCEISSSPVSFIPGYQITNVTRERERDIYIYIERERETYTGTSPTVMRTYWFTDLTIASEINLIRNERRDYCTY